MPGVIWTKVNSVDYGAGWSSTILPEGGYVLTSTGDPTSTAVIHRDSGSVPQDVVVEPAPAGVTITVTGTVAVVHQP